MVEYGERIDSQIADRLRTRHCVTVEDIPGLSAEQAAPLLRQYAELHGAEHGVRFDGVNLVETWSRPAPMGELGASYENVAPAYSPYGDLPPASPPASSGVPSGASPTATTAAWDRSPVDAVLAGDGGRSALDTHRSEAVPKLMWLLPVIFGLLGGLVGWLIVREEAPRTGRNLLILGVVITVLSFCSTAALGPVMGSLPSLSSASAGWPASQSGKPVFYYFGTST
jgi:hypothetical protein